MLDGDDVQVASRGDVDITDTKSAFDRIDLEPFHCRLKSVDRIDFCDDDSGTVGAKRMGASFAHIAVSANNGHFSCNHDIRRALESVSQGFAATVEVVEFGFCHRIVHIDRRHKQLADLGELVEAMNAGRRFLGDASPCLGNLGPEAGTLISHAAKERFDNRHLMVVCGFVGPLAALLELIALVDEKGDIATVINDELGSLVTGKGHGLESELPIFFECLALPCKNRGSRFGNGGGSVILCGENIATRPANDSAELDKRFNKNRCLDRHVQGTRHTNALEGLLLGILFTHRHETGHLVFSDTDFLASPIGKSDVRNDVIRTLGCLGGIFSEIRCSCGEFGEDSGSAGLRFGWFFGGHEVLGFKD